MKNAIQIRQRIIEQCLRVVRKIPSDKTNVNEEELNAIALLGAYRAGEGCAELLRVVAVKDLAKETGFAITGGRHMRWPKSFMDDYPAARALSAIGLPAARAIIADLEHKSPEKLQDDRMNLYAQVLIPMLMRDEAVAYMREALTHASEARVGEYERLLRVLEKTPPLNWKFMDPNITEP